MTQILKLADKIFSDRKANKLPTRVFMATDEELLKFAEALRVAKKNPETDIKSETDIVTRLRAGWLKPLYTPLEFNEAADEIEKLRSQVTILEKDLAIEKEKNSQLEEDLATTDY
jgi:hypothetical protein